MLADGAGDTDAAVLAGRPDMFICSSVLFCFYVCCEADDMVYTPSSCEPVTCWFSPWAMTFTPQAHTIIFQEIL
jgi:hypothetical protein